MFLFLESLHILRYLVFNRWRDLEMNLNINWSVYLSFDIHTGVASIEYSDFFFIKTNLEYKKLQVTIDDVLQCFEPSDKKIAESIFLKQSAVSEPVVIHVQLNEHLPVIELQAYVLYLNNSIEILCLDESIQIQVMKRTLLTDEIFLTIQNYTDLEKRLHTAHKRELITALLYNIRDLMQ